jgi:hypothetical protein
MKKLALEFAHITAPCGEDNSCEEDPAAKGVLKLPCSVAPGPFAVSRSEYRKEGGKRWNPAKR